MGTSGLQTTKEGPDKALEWYPKALDPWIIGGGMETALICNLWDVRTQSATLDGQRLRNLEEV